MTTREVILSEIRRLARDAGGKPPGKMVFTRLTGIQESAWSGRHWARWSDALAEAGLQANALQQRFSTADVLSLVIEGCRHYGRIPTVAEMKLYRRDNPSFPSKGTIAHHFPTRSALLQALADRTASDGSLAEVAAMVEREKPPSAPAPDCRTALAEGHVYLLKSGDFYKVGRSDDLERRIKEVRVALPEAVTLVHAIRTDDPPGIEAYWHRRFAAQRRNGEWFSLTAADVSAFRRRRYQ